MRFQALSAVLFAAAAALAWWAIDPPVETVEVLGPNRFRYAGRVLSRAEFYPAIHGSLPGEGGPSGLVSTPIRLAAPAETPFDHVWPALETLLSGPRARTNVTLVVLGEGGERSVSLPIAHSCIGHVFRYWDGDDEISVEDEDVQCAWVQVRPVEDGSLSVCGWGFGPTHWRPLTRSPRPIPEPLYGRRPALDSKLDPSALRSWFDDLEEAGVRPVLCLDYEDPMPFGRLVDELIAAKAAVGKRVLLGPNPWEEEELEDLEPLGGGPPDAAPAEDD